MSEIDQLILDIIKTIAILIPYGVLTIFFLIFKRDNFFLRARADTQYSYVMWVVAITFFLVIFWQISDKLSQVSFLGFDIKQDAIKHNIDDYKNNRILYIVTSNTSDTVLLLLGTLAAILGWLFSARAQSINARRTHSMQVLIESRMSETYTRNVNSLSLINDEFLKKCSEKMSHPIEVSAEKVKTSHYFKKFFIKDICVTPLDGKIDKSKISYEYFEKLNIEQKNIIFYMLNYLEFIALGVRLGDLDENLMKQTLKGILQKNYDTFELIILEKQKNRKETFEHIAALYKRWSNCN